jgi:hypothetical protein
LGGLGGCSAGKKLKVVSKEKEVLKTFKLEVVSECTLVSKCTWYGLLFAVEWTLLGLGWRRRWDRWKAERHARLMVLYERFHRI